MKVSFIHIYLTKKLIEDCSFLDDKLERSKAVRRICLTRFPMKCESKILDELVEIGFVKIIDRKNIQINREEFEKYNNTSYF